MTTDMKPVWVELTEAEGAQVQGGLSWFGNVVIPGTTSNGFINASIDWIGSTAGISIDIPSLRPILGFFGLTRINLSSR
jgi:hypothetical protein